MEYFANQHNVNETTIFVKRFWEFVKEGEYTTREIC